jgi:hypothetical protein
MTKTSDGIEVIQGPQPGPTTAVYGGTEAGAGGRSGEPWLQRQPGGTPPVTARDGKFARSLGLPFVRRRPARNVLAARVAESRVAATAESPNRLQSRAAPAGTPTVQTRDGALAGRLSHLPTSSYSTRHCCSVLRGQLERGLRGRTSFE